MLNCSEKTQKIRFNLLLTKLNLDFQIFSGYNLHETAFSEFSHTYREEEVQ